MADGNMKVLQGVREVFEMIDAPSAVERSIDQKGKLVLIGRGLDEEQMAKSLERTLHHGRPS